MWLTNTSIKRPLFITMLLLFFVLIGVVSYTRLGAEQYPQAIGALDRVKTLGGEKPGHLYYRAISLDHLNQYKPALEAYQKFLQASTGQHPDEEFKARQRSRILAKEISKR